MDERPAVVGGVSWSLDPQGIGWIVFRPPSGRPPLVDSRLLASLDSAIDALEPARALVLRSPTPDVYLAGADLDEILALSSPEEGADRARQGQRVLRRLEQLPVPTVAAIRGACLGAGVEVALACAYRLAVDDAATGFGFPETRHGMIPGLGGTVRLPRLVGLEIALDVILSGRRIPAPEAREIGLVDALVDATGFEDAVRGWVLERVEQGRLRTGVRRRLARRVMEDTAPGRRLVAMRAGRRLLGGDSPAAARRALDLALEALALPLDRAFEREARVAGELVASDEARGLVHASRGIARIERGGAPPGVAEHVGVSGGDAAQAEWVYLLASHGVPVRLRDPRRERLGETGRLALRRLAIDVRDGRISEAEADRSSALITASTGFGGFGALDAVVVAGGGGDVRDALREAEEHTSPGCLLCCASIGGRTADLQEESTRPDMLARVLLFPSPRQFPLLEIAPGPATSDAVLRRLEGLARQLGLTPLITADSPGGAGMRLMGAYLAEGMRLAAEGVDPVLVDRALEGFGFAAGPIRRAHAMGTDLAISLLRELAGSLGSRFAPPAHAPEAAREPPVEPVRARVLLALVNEAAMIIEERLLPSPRLLDAAALIGLGFPRARGGLLRYADTTGIPAIVDSLDELHARLGDRFEPSPVLRRLALAGDSFTGHSASPVV